MGVSPEDVELGLGRTATSDLERSRWSMWIDDALMLVEARLGDTAALNQRKLDYVVREAVIAHIKHPEDATQVSVSVDNASTARTYRSGKGRVTIPDDLWELLSPTERSTAFSVDTLWSATPHSPWCSRSFGSLYCSCGVDIAGEPIFEPGL